MTPTKTVNLESIRLRLIEGSQAASSSSVSVSKEGIQYLIKSLAYADTEFAAEIEQLLVQVGDMSIPHLLKGLHSTDQMTRSVCAMVLIRIGSSVEAPLIEASKRSSQVQPQLNWVYNFIFEELGLPKLTIEPHHVQQASLTAVAR